MERGWFAVHRKIFNSDVWQHPTAVIVWIYILGHITHLAVTLSERYQAITLQPGQMLTSVARIAAKCRLSDRSVRTALNYLKATSRVTIRTTNRFTVITVTNFPAYRDSMARNDKQNDKQNDRHPTSRRQADDNIQEDFKKIEKKKKDLPLPPAPSISAADRSQPEGEDDGNTIPESARILMAEVMKQINPMTAPKDGNNGGGEEGKTKEQPLTPEQQRAYRETLEAVRRGDKTPEDGALELQMHHGFTEGQADEAEDVMKP